MHFTDTFETASGRVKLEVSTIYVVKKVSSSTRHNLFG